MPSRTSQGGSMCVSCMWYPRITKLESRKTGNGDRICFPPFFLLPFRRLLCATVSTKGSTQRRFLLRWPPNLLHPLPESHRSYTDSVALGDGVVKIRAAKVVAPVCCCKEPLEIVPSPPVLDLLVIVDVGV